ncbi:MAG: hypothetical protein IKZ88_04380 [Neisseriaceae bacterium]|nr:hypothetical protein [Neisseriaceae bacterium]
MWFFVFFVLTSLRSLNFVSGSLKGFLPFSLCRGIATPCFGTARNDGKGFRQPVHCCMFFRL